MKVADWIGRKVRILDGPDYAQGMTHVGIVLAVDNTAARPSAWVKVNQDREYPSYRSCDLCWLEDIETGENGPAWGDGEYWLTKDGVMVIPPHATLK
jgi:hypothetical protein